MPWLILLVLGGGAVLYEKKKPVEGYHRSPPPPNLPPPPVPPASPPPPLLPPPPEPALGPVWVPVTVQTLTNGVYRVMSPYDGKTAKDALIAGLMSMGWSDVKLFMPNDTLPRDWPFYDKPNGKSFRFQGIVTTPVTLPDGLVVWWAVQPSAASGAAFEQLYASAPYAPQVPTASCPETWRDRIIEPGCSYLVTAPTGSRLIDDMVRGGEWVNAQVTRGNVSDPREARAKFLDSENTEGWRLRLTGTFQGPRTRLPPSVAVYPLTSA